MIDLQWRLVRARMDRLVAEAQEERLARASALRHEESRRAATVAPSTKPESAVPTAALNGHPPATGPDGASFPLKSTVELSIAALQRVPAQPDDPCAGAAQPC